MRDKYVICLEHPDSENWLRGWPLFLHPKDEEGCRDSISWQNEIGHEDEKFAICTVVPGLNAIMETEIDGRRLPVLIDQGPYNKASFAEFLVRAWG